MGKPELDVIFLCGGYGQRMGDLTKTQQKVMLPFRGKPIIEYGLEAASEAFGKINPILAVAYLGNQVKEYFGSTWKGQEIHYIPHPEGSEDRGVLRTVKSTLSGGPFVVVHGNIIYDAHALADNYTSFLKDRPLSTLSLARKSNESKHALVKVENGEITGLSIPDPGKNRKAVEEFLIDTYDSDKELNLMEQGWLRDMGINSYDHTIYDLVEKYTQPLMAHIFWMLVSEFSQGGTIGTSIYEGDWFHFQKEDDLVR